MTIIKPKYHYYKKQNYQYDTNSVSNDSEIKETNTKNMSCLDMLGLLSSYSLIVVFPNLYLADKALYIIPAKSASAERIFSKVKLKYYYVINRLSKDYTIGIFIFIYTI